MVDVPAIITGNSEETSHQLGRARCGRNWLLYVGGEIGGVNTELDGVSSVENLGREHVGRLVHVHRANDEQVLGKSNPGRIRFTVPVTVVAWNEAREAWLLGLHTGEHIREIALDVGEVHLVKQ